MLHRDSIAASTRKHAIVKAQDEASQAGEEHEMMIHSTYIPDAIIQIGTNLPAWHAALFSFQTGAAPIAAPAPIVRARSQLPLEHLSECCA